MPSRHVTIEALPFEDIPLGVEGGASPFAVTWQRVQLARHPKRPHTLDYVERLLTGFSEIHGDRAYGDDPAIVAGMGFFHEEPVLLLGHQKGRDTKQKLIRNFGMPKPEGYRKALRCMRMASKFRRPILALLDTPGAYPGIDAEERGQAEAIAISLREMTRLECPVVSVVIGEGGSGGALAMGVANIVLMMENAIYSVISPESCAAIIWRDAGKAELAANALRLTARDLLELGLIDGVIPEPNGGAQNDWEESAASLDAGLQAALRKLAGLTPKELWTTGTKNSVRLAVFSRAEANEANYVDHCWSGGGGCWADGVFDQFAGRIPRGSL